MGPRAEPILPARLDHPASGRGASLLSCGDVEADPGPPPADWGEEDYAVVPDLVTEACGRLGISPVRDAFATPANHRFPAYWTREVYAFAQPWDYATAGPLWVNPPFSRLEEVVTKAAREGCFMLVIARSGPAPNTRGGLRCVPCVPDGGSSRRTGPCTSGGGTDLMPAPRWRTWAFLLDSREGAQASMLPPPAPILPQKSTPGCRRRPGSRTRGHNS